MSNRPRFTFALVLSSSLILPLTGCGVSPTEISPATASAHALHGIVHGGQQPVNGAHVYLFAAASGVLTPNATGYGNPSKSLLISTLTGHSDTTGAYVLTDTNGNFSLNSGTQIFYTCPTASTQVYLYALGGNPGAGTNSAAGFLAALGSCSSLDTLGYIQINEATTIAAAYALAGFASDATDISSSGTSQAATGIANAFANAQNLASLTSGAALATTPAGNGTVPQSKINTLANILAACVNSAGPTSSACSTLFSNAESGTTKPTDTATAALYIAQNPSANIANLFALPTAGAPFAPALPATPTPSDFSISIAFTAPSLDNPIGVAIDSAGNAWVATEGVYPLAKFSPNGTAITGSSGYNDGTGGNAFALAIDPSDNVWTADYGHGEASKYSNSGTPATGSPFTATSYPYSIAIDGNSNVWVSSSATGSLAKLTNSGTQATGSPFSGGGLNDSYGLAVDSSENVWVSDRTSHDLTEFSPAGVPSSGSPYTSSADFGVAVDHANRIWTATGNGNVAVLNADGSAVTGSPFSAGGIDQSYAIAFDGAGDAWVASQSSSSVAEISSSGVALTGSSGLNGGIQRALGIAVDGSGDVWVPNLDGYSVTEFIGVAIPVVTPISLAVKNNQLATRP
jgi:streptogramin lyase